MLLDEENLESVNNSMAHSLSAKVGQLKNVSLDFYIFFILLLAPLLKVYSNK
jgi:hypothetical protein